MFMKNPFKKEDHTGAIIMISAGVAAGVALGWLFLTEKGSQYRRQISTTVKDLVSETVAKVVDKNTIIPEEVAKVTTDAVIKD